LGADLEIRLPSRPAELTQSHTSFSLETDVDDGEFLFNADDLALDNRTFLKISAAKAFVEQFSEVFTCVCCSGGQGVYWWRRAGWWARRAKCAGRRSRRPTAAHGIPGDRRKQPFCLNDGSVRRAVLKGWCGALLSKTRGGQPRPRPARVAST